MRKTAIIYVKDNERKAAQEFFCRLYSIENDYDVLYVTKEISEVDNCDLLIIANPSMISRNEIEYYGIVSDLRDCGIKVEIAITEENAGRYIDILTKEFKKEKAS